MANEPERWMVEGFSFYRSYYDAATCLNDQQRLAFYDAMTEYAFDGVEPNFDDTQLTIAWSLAKPNIRNSIANHANGRKGGRPKKADQQQETE